MGTFELRTFFHCSMKSLSVLTYCMLYLTSSSSSSSPPCPSYNILLLPRHNDLSFFLVCFSSNVTPNCNLSHSYRRVHLTTHPAPKPSSHFPLAVPHIFLNYYLESCLFPFFSITFHQCLSYPSSHILTPNYFFLLPISLLINFSYRPVLSLHAHAASSPPPISHLISQSLISLFFTTYTMASHTVTLCLHLSHAHIPN